MTESLYPIHSASIDAKAVRALRDAGCESVVIGIPWDMIAPHEAQALENHDQTLIRFLQRGGICANEAVNILTGQGNRNRLSPAEANRKLAGMIARWRAGQAEKLDGARHAMMSLEHMERDFVHQHRTELFASLENYWHWLQEKKRSAKEPAP